MKAVVSCLCTEEFYMTHTESSRFVSLSLSYRRTPNRQRMSARKTTSADSGRGLTPTSLAMRCCTGICALNTTSTIDIDFISEEEMVSETKLQVSRKVCSHFGSSFLCSNTALLARAVSVLSSCTCLGVLGPLPSFLQRDHA